MARFSRGGNAYKQTIRETEDGRTIERRVFGQVTRALEAASDTREGRRAKALHEALERNQRLWSTLLSDVMDRGNPLPDETKAGIISLALFVDDHTPEVLAGRKDLRPLIAINRGILAGLNGTAASPAAQEAGAAAGAGG